MGATPLPTLATAADLANLPEEAAAEVVGGEVVYKASPSFSHGYVQGQLGGFLRFGAGGRGSRGWFLVTEPDIELEPHEVYRPDLAGWRRERVPEIPKEVPVRLRPDWVCEVLSPSTAGRDLSTKLRSYHRNEIPHYWVVDPEHQTLVIYRRQADTYAIARSAGITETIQAEPFDVELPIALLFADLEASEDE
ncbi:MAG: Uma2 family endonuclease [Myxococcota bacterium]